MRMLSGSAPRDFTGSHADMMIRGLRGIAEYRGFEVLPSVESPLMLTLSRPLEAPGLLLAAEWDPESRSWYWEPSWTSWAECEGMDYDEALAAYEEAQYQLWLGGFFGASPTQPNPCQLHLSV